MGKGRETSRESEITMTPSDLLFQPEETLSPRLRWMRDNEIVTLMEPGQDGRQWVAFKAANGQWNAYGETELDALTDLAKKLGLLLWTETDYKK